jgi:hypothetical protein
MNYSKWLELILNLGETDLLYLTRLPLGAPGLGDLGLFLSRLSLGSVHEGEVGTQAS